jgi:hypothetical protein
VFGHHLFQFCFRATIRHQVQPRAQQAVKQYIAGTRVRLPVALNHVDQDKIAKKTQLRRCRCRLPCVV